MVKRRFFLGYGLLFFGGCTLTQTTESYKPLVYPNKLTFTVINLGDLDALERDFGAFRQALEAVLQVPVNFLAVGDYKAAIDALLANELDFAMVDPVAYLRLGTGAVPVVGVPRPDHTAMVISRGDSGVNQLSDLKGKTIAMGVDGSTAGHIMPMKMLLDAGLAPEDYGVIMGERGGFEALQSGNVAAWCGSSDRYGEVVKEMGQSHIQVLASSENLPPDLFVANPNLGIGYLEVMEMIILDNHQRLMDALLTSKANQKYKTSELVAVSDSNYQLL